MTVGRNGLVAVTLNAAIDQTVDCPDFSVGSVNRAAGQQRTAGGKGINVAAFVSGCPVPCPVPVTVTGFLGRENASIFELLFRDRGIRDHCLRLRGTTRVNIKIVDRPNQQVTDINLPGPVVPAEALTALITEIDDLAGRNHWFVLAGSVPDGVPSDIYGELVRHLRGRGAVIAVDASGAPLRHAIGAKPDMIKPNIQELSELLHRPVESVQDAARAALDLNRLGIGLVVVSMGGDGAIYAADDHAIFARPPRVEVVSTVGAGDAMVAGTLLARIAESDLETCARQGTAFAVGTLGEIGPVLPPQDRLEDLMRAVRVEAVR